MTQVCFEGTNFGAQHILNRANNSSWAWHTVATMLAIWDILSSQNDPLLGPQFHPPVWSIGGPISLSPP